MTLIALGRLRIGHYFALASIITFIAACHDRGERFLPMEPALAKGGDGGAGASCPDLPDGTNALFIAPPSVTLLVQTTVDLAVTTQSGDPVPDCRVRWSSSDAAVATVTSTGVVEGVTEGGPATVTVRTIGAGKPLTANAQISVRRLTLLDLSIPDSSLVVGDQLAVTATLRDNLGDPWPAGSVTWSIDNAAVLSLADGAATASVEALARGGVTVSASADGFNASLELRVAGWRSVSTRSWYEPCAVTTDDEAYCWSYGLWSPVIIPGGISWSTRDGLSQGCGLSVDGRWYCGPVTSVQAEFPAPPGLTWSIATNNCGMASDGTGYCWGNNWGGNVGVGSLGGYYPTPVPVAGGITWKSIDLGCGVNTADDGYCWGENYTGAAGIGLAGIDANGIETPYSRIAAPTLVAGNHKWKKIRNGSGHNCGIDLAGQGWCWGNDSNGQLGTSDVCTPIPGQAICTMPSPAPITIYPGPWKKLAMGLYNTCGLTVAGSIKCWGNGPGSPGGTWLDLDSGATAGPQSVCGVKAVDEGLYCWNYGNAGLGDATNPTRLRRTVP